MVEWLDQCRNQVYRNTVLCCFDPERGILLLSGLQFDLDGDGLRLQLRSARSAKQMIWQPPSLLFIVLTQIFNLSNEQPLCKASPFDCRMNVQMGPDLNFHQVRVLNVSLPLFSSTLEQKPSEKRHVFSRAFAQIDQPITVTMSTLFLRKVTPYSASTCLSRMRRPVLCSCRTHESQLTRQFASGHRSTCTFLSDCRLSVCTPSERCHANTLFY